MKRLVLLTLIVCLVPAVEAQSPGDVPKLSPGHQKMLEWCGQATITGKTFTTPLGPSRQIQGIWIGKPILGGFAIEGDYVYEGHGPNGETQGKEIVSYDPKTDKYTYTFLTDNGYCETARFTQEGAVAAWQTPCVRDGKQYQLRGTDTDLPDGTGFVRREEISADGQAWLPFHESRFVFAETAGTSDRAVALGNSAAKAGAAALEGVWEIEEQKVDGSPQDLAGRRGLKTYQDGRWHVVYYDTSTGKVDTTLGGPYTFDGKTLNETIGYINQDEGIAYVGATLTFDVQIREGRFHQSGDFFGMKLEEVWAPASPTP